MSKLIDPAAYAASSESEHCQQVAVMMWAAIQAKTRWPELKWLHAVPNGGLRDPRTAAMLKAEGVKPGVPDLDLPLNIRRNYDQFYTGLHIEMKRKGYKPSDVSDDQRAWHVWLLEQGRCVRICGGYSEAIETLSWYMGLSNE